MVKGLKVLRHKRTEGGYFNEFLIAKTPDDVENCPFPTATAAAMAPLPTVASSPGVPTSLAFPQASVYSPAVDFILNSSSATGAQWQFHHTQHQQQQFRLCPSSHPAERQTLHDSRSSDSSGIARQEVVVTSSASVSSTSGAAAAAISAERPAGMSAGLGKMKLNMNRGDSERTWATQQPRRPATATAKSATATDDTWQRRANRRRERNRAAAARCRKKRQDQLEGLAAEVRELESERAGLESRVAGLTAARSDLLRRLHEHRLTCPEAPGVSSVAMEAPSFSSLTTVFAVGNPPEEEILLTPSLLLPPSAEDDPFKLEPL